MNSDVLQFGREILHDEARALDALADSLDGPFEEAVKLIKGAKAIYYPGAPHGITATHLDRINADLLAFIKG